MPSNSDMMAQAEFGRFGLRETRRSTFRSRGLNSGRSENSNQNYTTGIGKANRKSPRMSSGRPMLADITNFTGPKAARQGKNHNRDNLVGLENSNARILPGQILHAPSATPKAPEAPVSNISVVIDECVRSDVQSVTEYAADIHALLFREETKFLPSADYMAIQVDITSKMRTILVDWLIDVHMKYRLRAETLHLTMNLVDRYLSRTTVMRKRLQLVGVVSMFIASKFEEINPPEVRDWVYITDNAYTKDDVLLMECHMLTTLSFQIVVPTAAQFFDFLPKANGCDDVHRALAQYILELGLLDIRMLQHTPSHVASAALLLSNKLMKQSTVWPSSMAKESRHSETSLAGCVEELRQLWEADQAGEGGQLRAVHKKFSSVDRHSVAKLCHYNAHA